MILPARAASDFDASPRHSF